MFDQALVDMLRKELPASAEEVEMLLKELESREQVGRSNLEDMLEVEGGEGDVLQWCREEREGIRRRALREGVSPEVFRWRRRPPGRKPRRELEERRASERTREHAAAVARLVARHATEREDVAEARRRFVGERPASPERARYLLASEDFRARGGGLDGVVENLSAAYGWARDDALWFLLTGDPPQTDPLEVEIVRLGDDPHAPSAIRIVAFPGTPAEEVAAAYRAAQYDFLGGDNRPAGDKALELFRFVTTEQATAEDRPSARELMERWNRRYPAGHEYRYPGLREFNRDLGRIEGVARKYLSGGADRLASR